jgi:hypothetical protein
LGHWSWGRAKVSSKDGQQLESDNNTEKDGENIHLPPVKNEKEILGLL